MRLNSFTTYQRLIARVDEAACRIQHRYADQIACRKGCAGNCCRIHLTVFAVEAIWLASALKKVPRQMGRYIQNKAANTSVYGPCPLLEEGACLMYASRLIICRTHGLPMLTEYRGHRAIGFCQKNFRNLNPIPYDAIIDLDDLNRKLASINDRFMGEFSEHLPMRPRLYIGEALLLE